MAANLGVHGDLSTNAPSNAPEGSDIQDAKFLKVQSNAGHLAHLVLSSPLIGAITSNLALLFKLARAVDWTKSIANNAISCIDASTSSMLHGEEFLCSCKFQELSKSLVSSCQK